MRTDFVALGFQCILVFFLTEDFKATRWIAGTVTVGLRKLGYFTFVLIAIILGSSVILNQLHGAYFHQYRGLGETFLDLFGYVIGAPVNNMDRGVDTLVDEQSLFLAIVYIILTFFAVVVAGNIFISIILEAYAKEKEIHQKRPWLADLPSSSVYKRNEKTLSGIIVSFFPNIFVPTFKEEEGGSGTGAKRPLRKRRWRPKRDDHH